MHAQLKKIFSTATFRQTSLTSVSSVINGLLGAAFYFWLARLLGKTDYGQFSVITSVITTVAGVAELGGNQAIVKFASREAGYVKAVFTVKLLSAIIVIFLLLLLFPMWWAVLVGSGVLAQLLFSFSVSFSQSLQKYVQWSVLLIGTNLLRLIFVVVSLPDISNLSASIIYIICPLIGFLTYGIYIKFSFLRIPLKKQYFLDIFSFNKWVTAFVLVNTAGSRLDIFLTAHFTNLASTGVYSLAAQLVAILPQLTTAVGAVSSPKFASFIHPRQNMAYLRKSLLFSSGIALAASVALIIITSLVISFTGRDYSSAWTPFIVLLAGMDIFLMTSPLRDSILYYYSRPRFFVWIGLVQIAVTISLSWLLIPAYGILGSSLLVLIGQLVLAVICVSYYIYLTRHG